MALFGTEERRKIGRVFTVLTTCSGDDAATAADLMCRDPKATILLGAACGFTAGTIARGATSTKAAEAVEAWPPASAITSARLAGAYRAKLFCSTVVDQIADPGIESIPESAKNILRAVGQG